jgi:hypothetical protein
MFVSCSLLGRPCYAFLYRFPVGFGAHPKYWKGDDPMAIHLNYPKWAEGELPPLDDDDIDIPEL